jgi:hypothetical protein
VTRVTNIIAGHRKQIAELEQAIEQLHQISPQPNADASDDEAA